MLVEPKKPKPDGKWSGEQIEEWKMEMESKWNFCGEAEDINSCLEILHKTDLGDDDKMTQIVNFCLDTDDAEECLIDALNLTTYERKKGEQKPEKDAGEKEDATEAPDYDAGNLRRSYDIEAKATVATLAPAEGKPEPTAEDCKDVMCTTIKIITDIVDTSGSAGITTANEVVDAFRHLHKLAKQKSQLDTAQKTIQKIENSFDIATLFLNQIDDFKENLSQQFGLGEQGNQ